jgi:hypothetical protein
MAIGACSSGFEVVRGRRAGLAVAVVAGLFAAWLAGAPGASALTFVHSAKSGELRDGRLILRGVSGRVTYLTGSGRTATAKVKRVHKGVFLPGRPATAVLHVAGHRGGDEPSFRLSRARYNAARRTVSFKARRLASKRLPAGAAGTAGIARTRSLFGTSSQAGPSSGFGRSSLTVNSHPTVASGQTAGNVCEVFVENRLSADPPAPNTLTLSARSWSKWDTDTWDVLPPRVQITPPPDGIHQVIFGIQTNDDGQWRSYGSDYRGCHNEVIFEFDQHFAYPRSGTFTIDVTWPLSRPIES